MRFSDNAHCLHLAVPVVQAQAAAAEAARQLEAVMSRRPAGSGALRSALSKAEEAAAALSSAGGAPVLNEVLLPLIQVRSS